MRRDRSRTRAAFVLGGSIVVASAMLLACGWDPSRPFDRDAPTVREAISHLDGGDASAATELLETYLATGTCQEGNIGTPQRVREKKNASFDLGLALFRIGERFGKPFGDEEVDAGEIDPTLKTSRAEQITCAERIVRAVAEDPNTPIDLRARARYLEGNLRFLNADYEDAVSAYDKAVELIPGMGDSGILGRSDGGPRAEAIDALGRDAAYNRAIALRRIEDKKDAGTDASSDAASDSGGSDSGDSGGDGGGGDSGSDQGDSGKPDAGGGAQDAGTDGGGEQDASNDNEQPKPPPEQPDSGPEPPPPPSKQSQDERMLDQLENAPTVQQEAARKAAERRKVRGIEDK